MKLVSALALVGLLAACNAGATTPSDTALPSIAGDQSALPSAADGTPVAMACEDAFASLDLTAMSSMTSLSDVTDELDATISACPGASDWIAAAQAALPAIDMADAEAFLQARCADSPTLATTPICTEVGS